MTEIYKTILKFSISHKTWCEPFTKMLHNALTKYSMSLFDQ